MDKVRSYDIFFLNKLIKTKNIVCFVRNNNISLKDCGLYNVFIPELKYNKLSTALNNVLITLLHSVQFPLDWYISLSHCSYSEICIHILEIDKYNTTK